MTFNEFYEEVMQQKVPVLARGGKFTMSTETFRKYLKMAYEQGARSKQMDSLFGSLFK
jgi:DhnA family fructose-bisphosphate aldolase class Ia